MIITVLGTLPFLATLGLLLILGAAILEESGAKIAAALKGPSADRSCALSKSSRSRSRCAQPVRRASVEWRAAA